MIILLAFKVIMNTFKVCLDLVLHYDNTVINFMHVDNIFPRLWYIFSYVWCVLFLYCKKKWLPNILTIRYQTETSWFTIRCHVTVLFVSVFVIVLSYNKRIYTLCMFHSNLHPAHSFEVFVYCIMLSLPSTYSLCICCSFSIAILGILGLKWSFVVFNQSVAGSIKNRSVWYWKTWPVIPSFILYLKTCHNFMFILTSHKIKLIPKYAGSEDMSTNDICWNKIYPKKE